MGVAGTYQFVWSSIRVPIRTGIGIPEARLGTVFTLFIVFQTVSQFPAGWVRDRYGPRIPMLGGAVALASGYALVASADGLLAVYLAYVVGGIGAGIAYTVALNTGVKWFNERRGFATGVVGMAYGGVSFLVIPAVRGGIRTEFRRTLLLMGAGAGLVALVAAVVLRDPERSGSDAEDPGGEDPGEAPASETPDAHTGSENPETRSPAGNPDADEDPTTWREAVRTWQFWHLYVVFVVVTGVGLMVVGKVVSYAGELGLSAATATAAASVVAVSDAGGVVSVGAVSDRVGRERTSAATLVLSGLALVASVAAGDRGIGLAFVALVGAVAFFRSPVFAVFPSLVGDYYGEARSSENYAVLYTAKLPGGVFGGTVASGLVLTLGWSPSFLLGGALVVVAGLSLVALRPPDV
ncbi:oxalate:formate antiporter [Halobacteriales archaeon QS_8_69_26]|nr:MAG: oxalate:formate antiporter [Halobacteriales archaeon QS_8_69_26]